MLLNSNEWSFGCQGVSDTEFEFEAYCVDEHLEAPLKNMTYKPAPAASQKMVTPNCGWCCGNPSKGLTSLAAFGGQSRDRICRPVFASEHHPRFSTKGRLRLLIAIASHVENLQCPRGGRDEVAGTSTSEPVHRQA